MNIEFPATAQLTDVARAWLQPYVEFCADTLDRLGVRQMFVKQMSMEASVALGVTERSAYNALRALTFGVGVDGRTLIVTNQKKQTSSPYDRVKIVCFLDQSFTAFCAERGRSAVKLATRPAIMTEREPTPTETKLDLILEKLKALPRIEERIAALELKDF